MPLGAAKTLELRNTGQMKWGRCQVMTGATVFQGQLLSFQYATVGHVMPMTAVSGASMPCVGISVDTYTTAPTAGGTQTTAYYFWNVEAKCQATAISAGMLGQLVYAAGDSSDKVCGLLTLGNPVGTIKELDGTSYAWVEIGVYPALTYA